MTVQSIAGVLESTMILAVLDTLPEGRTRANRRGYMVEILTTRVRTKANSVSDLKNGKRKILETADCRIASVSKNSAAIPQQRDLRILFDPVRRPVSGALTR
jgi:hypothetical protein